MMPSEEHIRSLSFDTLCKSGLTSIKYHLDEYVRCITFCFNELRSPPKGTYLVEPNKTFIVPDALDLG